MRILIILICSLSTISKSQNLNIENIRKEYLKVNSDSASCAKLFQKINKQTCTNNIEIAYNGAITATMANYPKNKLEKLKLFNIGKNKIEQSLSNDPKNLELHFIRFTIQSMCPKMLGYSKEIESDKNYIFCNFEKETNQQLKINILNFLSASSSLTESEKKKLKSIHK